MAEDEPLVVRVVTMGLSVAGFRAAVAENGAVALEIYRELREEICIVLADVLMPAVTGVQLADRIREVDPEMPILLMTGYSDHELVNEAQKRYPVLRKPFLHADLIRRIRSVLDAGQSAMG